MAQNSVLDLLRLNTYVPLGGSSAAMLQEVLDEGNVVVVVLVDLRSIVFAEAMGADPLIAQPVASMLQDHLNIAYRDREDPIFPSDPVPVTVILDELVQDHRHGESALLLGFLLGDVKPVSVAVPDDIAEAQ